MKKLKLHAMGLLLSGCGSESSLMFANYFIDETKRNIKPLKTLRNILQNEKTKV